MKLGNELLVQIISPPIMYFVLGIVSTRVKSGLKVPEMSRVDTMWLVNYNRGNMEALLVNQYT